MYSIDMNQTENEDVNRSTRTDRPRFNGLTNEGKRIIISRKLSFTVKIFNCDISRIESAEILFSAI